jgi:hypothetical protein
MMVASILLDLDLPISVPKSRDKDAPNIADSYSTNLHRSPKSPEANSWRTQAEYLPCRSLIDKDDRSSSIIRCQSTTEPCRHKSSDHFVWALWQLLVHILYLDPAHNMDDIP